MDDNNELELTPEPDDEEEVFATADDFEYRPGLVLVPVRCGVCKLLMYAKEEQVGMWKICPDCGRRALIRAVPTVEKVVVELSESGAYRMRACEAAQKPTTRIVSDYRAVPGSVDFGTERAPNIVLPEADIDPLEHAVDKLLDPGKRKKAQTPKPVSAPGTPSNTPSAVPAGMPPTVARNIPEKPKSPPILERTIQHEPDRGETKQGETKQGGMKQTAPRRANGLKRFFHPFFAARNRTRFLLDIGCGVLAVYMTLNMIRFWGLFLFHAADDFIGTKEIIWFLFQYMVAFLPFAVWFVMVTINGMSLFVQTKDGDSDVDSWMKFRTEFAIHYFCWIVVIMLTAPIPGLVAYAALYANGVCPEYRWLVIPVSLFVFFPILFLSVADSDEPFELFNGRVWKSVICMPGKWLSHYLAVLPLWLCFVVGVFAAFALAAETVEANFFLIQIPYLLSAIVLCQVFRWTVYLWFRLLGTLGWSITAD